MISEKKKSLRRNPLSGFFRPKTGDLQKENKKKVFAEIRRLFLAKIKIWAVFPAKNTNFFLPETSAQISIGGRLNLDEGTLNRDGGTLNLDGGMRPPPSPLQFKYWA